VKHFVHFCCFAASTRL